eukprot:s3977_g1.t1
MLGGLLGDADESAGPSQLFLIEAKVVVISSNDAMPLLSAALDRSETDGPLEIFEGDQLDDEVTILYDCWQQGTARVELRFLLASEPEGQPGTEICMAWRKRCGSFAFDALEVRNSQSLIYPAPKEGTQQPALLSPEGTYEEVTKLQLSSSGAMRLKVPKVSSEEQLKVEIRGLATDALEVHGVARSEAVAAAAQPEMPQGQPIARQPVQPDPEALHVEEWLQEPEEVERDLEARSVAGVSVFSDPHVAACA